MKNFLNQARRRLTLKQMRGFAAIVEHGTITGAAAAIGVTPPAILHQLREIEDGLGLPLLERGNGRAIPTQAGREILATVARIETEIDDCLEAIAALAGMRRGQVAVGVISTAKYFAPSALAAFKRAHPEIDLRLKVGNRGETVAALERFDIDFAIMGRPPEHFEVTEIAIGPHPHVIIAAPDHPLAGRAAIPPAALLDQTFLLREPGSGTRALVQRLFESAGLDPAGGMEIGSNETIKQAVMADMGIALISAHTIAAEWADRRIAVLDVVGLPILRQWYLVRRREKRLLPAARALWEHLVREGGTFLPKIDPPG
jgi:LysR family transcriptional regulator for metE and metH